MAVKCQDKWTPSILHNGSDQGVPMAVKCQEHTGCDQGSSQEGTCVDGWGIRQGLGNVWSNNPPLAQFFFFKIRTKTPPRAKSG